MTTIKTINNRPVTRQTVYDGSVGGQTFVRVSEVKCGSQKTTCAEWWNPGLIEQIREERIFRKMLEALK